MSVHLIDDGDAGFSTTGAWSAFSDPSFGQGDTRQASAGSGATASYDFGALGAGNATAELQWNAYANRATNVAWQIKVAGVVVAAGTINQQEWPASAGPGTFRTIGTVPLAAGESLVVTISAGTNGYTVADQCRVTFTPSVPPPPPPSTLLASLLADAAARRDASKAAADEQYEFDVQRAHELAGA